MLYVVVPTADLAYGRFIGPETLVARAVALQADLGWSPGPNWRAIVDVLEAHGTLRPVLRWREAAPVLVRMMAQLSPGHADPALPQEPDGDRLDARRAFESAASLWHLRGHAPQRLHPLDDPPCGSGIFLEDPASVPWTPATYDRIPVGRIRGEPLLDPNACVPLFRSWQVLHLLELALGGPRHFDGLDWRRWKESGERGAPGAVRWFATVRVEGFAVHRAALEAVSWHQAYATLALQHAEATPVGRNRYRIQGDALRRLREAEALCAREAAERHGVDQAAVSAMLGWAGERALHHERASRLPARDAYRALFRSGVELLRDLGLPLEAVKAGVPGGARLFGELFPSWVAVQRRIAEATLRSAVLPELARGVEGFLDPPSDAEVADFLGWVEEEGLLALYSSFEALTSFGHRPDPDADAGTILHVAALSAWVEHVCNAILDRRRAEATSPSTLNGKLLAIWAGDREGADFRRSFGALDPGNPAHGLPAGSHGAAFRARMAWLRSNGGATGAGFAARDARMALQIRNQAQHRNLAFLDREELIDGALLLVRVAFLAWVFDRCRFPA